LLGYTSPSPPQFLGFTVTNYKHIVNDRANPNVA
jgi:hypothetical protein